MLSVFCILTCFICLFIISCHVLTGRQLLSVNIKEFDSIKLNSDDIIQPAAAAARAVDLDVAAVVVVVVVAVAVVEYIAEAAVLLVLMAVVSK